MPNKRLLDITQLLLEQDGYITISAISQRLNVSNKTIRNDLNQIADWLADSNLVLVRKTGVGIAISGEKSAKLSVLRQLQKKEPREHCLFSPGPQGLYPDEVTHKSGLPDLQSGQRSVRQPYDDPQGSRLPGPFV